MKNRSQIEIDNGTNLHQAKAREVEFFRNHPVYSKLDPHLWGVEKLTQKLTRILASRIQHALPEIQREVDEKLSKARNELRNMGVAPPTTSVEMRAAFIEKVHV